MPYGTTIGTVEHFFGVSQYDYKDTYRYTIGGAANARA